MIGHPLRTTLIAALLGTQVVACTRGDIVLGERGGMLASSGHGSPDAGVGEVPSGGRAADAGGQGGAGAGMVAAGSFAAGGGGVAAIAGTGGIGTRAGAGGAAAAGAGGSGATSRPSTGCSIDPAPPGPVTGTSVTYIRDLPATYDKSKPYPLVLAYRDADITVDAFRASLNLPSAVGDDAIVVYANCVSETSCWDVQHDMPVFDTLLRQLTAGYCIDQARMFAVGHGAGAAFASTLGCVRGDKLRGVAPLSGSTPPPGGCIGEVAVWMMQDTTDAVNVGPARGTRDFWAAANHCDVRMFTPVMPAPCMIYGGCDAGFPVGYCEYEGEAALTSSAAQSVWGFFRGF
jgi:polyhydroxybutyrate depolymerase